MLRSRPRGGDTTGALGVYKNCVVIAVTLETTVFREPTEGGDVSRSQVLASVTVTPHLVPCLAVPFAEH